MSNGSVKRVLIADDSFNAEVRQNIESLAAQALR